MMMVVMLLFKRIMSNVGSSLTTPTGLLFSQCFEKIYCTSASVVPVAFSHLYRENPDNKLCLLCAMNTLQRSGNIVALF